jgi:hypothetical protein
MALAITDATFTTVVLKSDKPVVSRFFGQLVVDHVEWLDQLSTITQRNTKEKQLDRKKLTLTQTKICPANTGKNIPTVLIFKTEVVGRQVSVAPKRNIYRCS